MTAARPQAGVTPAERDAPHTTAWQRAACLLLFFLICLGLGYPVLNRYDMQTAVPDSADYAAMVRSGADAARPAYRARLLVPYLAKPFARMAQGLVGSWDPVSFGLLVANGLLAAGTAYVLLGIALKLFGEMPVAMVASLLYLANFAVSNLMLAGMVDAGEAFFLAAVTRLLLDEHWGLLPVVAVFGAASKETIVPFLAIFAAVWAIRGGKDLGRRLLWTGVAGLAGLGTVTVLLSLNAGHTVWPWSFARGLSSGGSYLRSALAVVTNRGFWYIFGWLLPLGLVKVRSLPRVWILACTAAGAGAILLSAYHNQPADAGPAAARALFNIAGPMLSLAAARALCSGDLT